MENNKPVIVTFQMQNEDFFFLGIENPRNSDMGKVWDNFDKMGGWDMNSKYHKKPYNAMMVVWQYNNPENKIYFPGTIVENVDIVPEGFTLKKFFRLRIFGHHYGMAAFTRRYLENKRQRLDMPRQP